MRSLANRAVGIAFAVYQTDHDDTSPPRNDGVANFANSGTSNFLGSPHSYVEYQHRIFMCPSAKAVTGATAPNQTNDTGYLGNAVVLGRRIATRWRAALRGQSQEPAGGTVAVVRFPTNGRARLDHVAASSRSVLSRS